MKARRKLPQIPGKFLKSRSDFLKKVTVILPRGEIAQNAKEELVDSKRGIAWRG